MNLDYKIKCDNCSAVYVGQTKRKISSRIKECFNNISHRCQQLSVVSENRLEKIMILGGIVLKSLLMNLIGRNVQFLK